MQYVMAKLVKDDIKGHSKYRTLYKTSPDKVSFDSLIMLAAKQLPADVTELEVLVNAPTIYLYPIIELCQLRNITLLVTHPTDKNWEHTERFTLLRFWTCSVCHIRYSISHETWPYCGGLGFYLALPVPEDEPDETVEDQNN